MKHIGDIVLHGDAVAVDGFKYDRSHAGHLYHILFAALHHRSTEHRQHITEVAHCFCHLALFHLHGHDKIYVVAEIGFCQTLVYGGYGFNLTAELNKDFEAKFMFNGQAAPIMELPTPPRQGMSLPDETPLP